MSEKFFERRPQPSQFPSKLSALPHIGGSAPSSPVPGHSNQLVPYGARASVNPDIESERYRQLETRINISERSNRALLEEVVRLQSEQKASIRRNEEMVRQEQQNRQQIEHALRSSNELVSQLSSRLKRTEDKLADEKSTLSTLMNQHKTVEQAVLGGQQELMSRRDMHSTKIDDIQSQLDEVTRIKDQLERVTYTMADEMRQMKAKIDTQTVDLVSNVNDLKHKSKRLEDENRQALDSLRKQNETHNVAEQSTYQLRAQVENRLAELRDVVVDLRTKHDSEVQQRRSLENQIQTRLADVQASISEQSRKRDEAMIAMDTVQREREHNTDAERIRLQSKIAEIAEEVSKKILQKEMKIREENAQKFSQIEQALVYEQDSRQKFEKQSREDMERRWDSLKKLSDDDLQLIKDQIKSEKKKSTETLHTLNRAVNLVEKQMDEHKKQQDKLLSAEIKSRKQSDQYTKNKMEDMEDKLRVATSTLQQAIGSTASQIKAQNDKVRKDLREELEENKRAETRHLADLDTRLTALTNKLAQSEDVLEAKIVSNIRAAQINEETTELNLAKKIQDQQIQEMMSEYYVWKDSTERAVQELKSQNQKLPQDMYELEEKVKMDRATTDTQIGAEAESRKRQIQELKDELGNQDPGPQKEASNKEIEACQSSIRKLAESIQTVKTVLGMKIQSEQKLRETTIENVQEEIDEIQEKLEDLMKDKKDDDKDDDDKKDDKDDKKDDKDDKKDDKDDKKDDDDDDEDDDDDDDDDEDDDDDKKKDGK